MYPLGVVQSVKVMMYIYFKVVYTLCAYIQKLKIIGANLWHIHIAFVFVQSIISDVLRFRIYQKIN